MSENLMAFFYRSLFALVLSLGAAAQDAQPFDVAFGGADNWCVLVTRIPFWRVQFSGSSPITEPTIEFIAAGTGARVLGLVNRGGGPRVIEVRPDGTATPVLTDTGHSGEELVADAARQPLHQQR